MHGLRQPSLLEMTKRTGRLMHAKQLVCEVHSEIRLKGPSPRPSGNLCRQPPDGSWLLHNPPRHFSGTREQFFSRKHLTNHAPFERLCCIYSSIAKVHCMVCSF